MKPAVLIIFAITCCVAVAEAQQFYYTNPPYYNLVRRSTTPWPRTRTQSKPKVNPNDYAPRADFTTPNQMVAPRNDEVLSRAVANLAFSIGSGVDGDGSSDIFSPVSIMGVLNLLLLGSDGITRKELLAALNMVNVDSKQYHHRAAGMLNNLVAQNPQHLEQLAWKGATCVVYDYSDEEVEAATVPKPKELRITNGIFTQRNLPVNKKFTQLANQLYGATMRPVNFRDSLTTASEINKWVSQATNGRIREVTNGQFSQDTNMVIASSLYFKAFWQTEFTARATRPRDFFLHGSGRDPVKVDMMTLSECLPYYYDKPAGLRMIGLPYSDNTTTMYIIMPLNSTRAKVRGLQNQLSAERVDSMISKMTRRTATVNLPRMQLTSSTNLEKSFRRLGINSIFSAQQSNLRSMLDQTASGAGVPLFVSQITHKVNLNVDEQGTEGAAVTVTLVDRSASSVYFNVNEPFLIYVRHDPTRLPLFYGSVFDPRG